QNGFLAACEPHVAGQRKLTSDTCGAPSDCRDRYNRNPAESHQHVGKWLQASRSRWYTGCVLRFGQKVVVSQKESIDRAVKNHHFDMLIRFKCGDDLVQLRKILGTKDVERRKIKRDSPICG